MKVSWEYHMFNFLVYDGLYESFDQEPGGIWYFEMWFLGIGMGGWVELVILGVGLP